MDNLRFQKTTITIGYIKVQQILIVTFEFTGAARGYMIMSCAARGVKKVGQHCYTSNSLPSHYSPLNLDYQLTKVDVEYRRSTGIRSVPEDGIQCFFLCLRHCVTGEHLTRNAVVPFMDCHCLQKQKYIKVHMIILCLNWFLFVEGIFSF